MEQRIPPQNIEAEQSLLGCLLIDPGALDKVADIVQGEDFYKDAHRLIFEATLDLYAKHEPVDLLSLGNRLEEKNQLQNIGGRSTIAELTNSVTTAGNVVHYAKIVQKKATLRRLISAASTIAEMGYHE